MLRRGTFLLAIMLLLGTVFPLFAVNGDSTEAPVKYDPEFFNQQIEGSVAKVFGMDKRVTNVKFADPLNPGETMHTHAGTFRGEVDGENAKFYCIDLGHNIIYYTNNQPHTYTDFGPTDPKITYILNYYYPFISYTGTNGQASSENIEAASVQFAIWHFSDGLDIQTIWHSNNDIKDELIERAGDIIADANLNYNSLVPLSTLVIDPFYQVQPSGTPGSFTVKAYDGSLNPISGLQISINSADGTLGSNSETTGSDGCTPPISISQLNGGLTAEFIAVANVIIPQGTKYVHFNKPDKYQKLVLATPTQGNKKAFGEIDWTDEADLTITKTASTDNPQVNEEFSYTITVTNLGPGTATDVVVYDEIPAGLTVVSVNESQGTYDENTGEWQVGTLQYPGNATLTVTVVAEATSFNNTVIDLKDAGEFNAFIIRDCTQPSSDTEGKMAVGRNAILSNYSVGDKLTTTGEDVLIVGKNLTYVSGRVYNGNVVYGKSADLSPMVSVDGTVSQGNPIDFSKTAKYLKTLSGNLYSQSPNGTAVMDGSHLRLQGQDPFYNVFFVDGTDLNAATHVSVEVPSGAIVVVNVSGKTINWSGLVTLAGATERNVLFNFYKAKNIHLSNIDIRGSILSPKGFTVFESGVINGQLIVYNLEGRGQMNNTLFCGVLPPDEDVTNVAAVSSVTYDPDVENNDAEVTVHIGGNEGHDIGNWTFVSEFGNQIIWDMTNEGGTTYAGTWGGKVMKTNDMVQWDTLNDGMNVGYVWAVALNNGRLFAATENGVFYTDDEGANWTLSTLTVDTRDLLVYNGVLYAGTWGNGMYRSADNGDSWAAINNGLQSNIINALTVDATGTIYAAVYGGGGVASSADGGDTWTAHNTGFDYVWSIGVTSDGSIFAGTYGIGMLHSTDGGSSWNPFNNGLIGNHIYTIRVDAADNVYASVWGSGVYLFNPNIEAYTWQSMGLKGRGVSTLIFSEDGSVLYAAGTDGALYSNDDPLMDVHTGSTEMPGSFDLYQNYPNPFNPSTTIKYTLPETQNVTLKVYDILGSEIVTLVNETQIAGTYQVTFNASDLASGVYFYRLEAGSFNAVKKLMLMK